MGTFAGALMSGGISGAWSGQARQAAGTARAWEYQVVVGNQYNSSRAISELNRLGEQGFEVAGYSSSLDSNASQYFSVLLKRIKP
jgi:hypothetical protein